MSLMKNGRYGERRICQVYICFAAPDRIRVVVTGGDNAIGRSRERWRPGQSERSWFRFARQPIASFSIPIKDGEPTN